MSLFKYVRTKINTWYKLIISWLPGNFSPKNANMHKVRDLYPEPYKCVARMGIESWSWRQDG